MTREELSRYQTLVMGPAPARRALKCWLCGLVFKTGDECLLVPTTCEDTEKMERGEPYENLLAHRRCLERIP